ncbi:branched-chain amino acid ABC transporter permease [Calidifontimicrobium sp. SYSU G02091]|uniref:branched-chain amino acid ABC transporter permease n=1 Tax=Calidifontimicrobium sp. SYSU G02091 TaxID=2926421 RepID=UPI001F530C3D|nr:branched-chain amino acid ABC transporter permease [Calidifontimicrobium sp. SYSU G02091]MCI1191214.1 branched-chain amino acid ABC transporter permease [Calidifontimicrobium sp. SYSU G02091]
MRFDYHTRYRDAQALLRTPGERWAYALLAVALLALPWVASRFVVGEASYLVILAIASLGLMLLTGYTGQVSLGHAAFMAVGAYAHAWLLGRGVPLPLSLPAAGLLAAAVGALLGLPAIRVSGLYLAMVTLAFSVLVTHVAGHWTSVTGGFTGIAVPSPQVAGWSLGGPAAFYYLCLAVLVIVFAALLNVTRSSLGRALVGVRDSEAASWSLGLPVARIKVLAFAGSAGITGLAGALLAHHLQYLTPDAFTLLLSMELVLMVVIGGLGSLRGAVLGALLIGLLPPFISRLKPFLPDAVAKQFGLETFVFGFVLALFVLFEPTGLNGRWLKLRALVETFPLYRRDTFRRGKRYMRSERYR